MAKNLALFPAEDEKSETHSPHHYRPLADRMRPVIWDDFAGIESLDKRLIEQLSTGKGTPPSIVIWGPPGSGKTTLARLIGKTYSARFVPFSAVLGGVKEVRQIMEEAKGFSGITILFVDEIHRFNKAQQDAFLPHIENGTIVIIGATTENPSFYLTSALLSRLRVVALPALSEESLRVILDRASKEIKLNLTKEAKDLVVQVAAGDARRLLNLLEGLRSAFSANKLDIKELQAYLREAGSMRYDRAGEQHYNIISAFIKSMRGSDPDAALYWAFRMIEAGEDPRFIIRRMIIFAAEDIGNADPRALQLAVSTAEAFERVGLPEGRIPIAQCITFLATAPKSNRSYQAMHRAIAAIKEDVNAEVPLHLRNAPTKLMESLGYGAEYEYPHENEQAFVSGVTYLPERLKGAKFYEPSDRGYEKSIFERLQQWRGKS